MRSTELIEGAGSHGRHRVRCRKKIKTMCQEFSRAALCSIRVHRSQSGACPTAVAPQLRRLIRVFNGAHSGGHHAQDQQRRRRKQPRKPAAPGHERDEAAPQPSSDASKPQQQQQQQVQGEAPASREDRIHRAAYDAYDAYVRRGEPGDEVQDWLDAESQVDGRKG
ncbi:DUF2934 domain-containing protein [Variovorax sp. OK605]|uniref:DUF2934 domain-containing protein n=1 Tax=Variovorax sp. OK605 TaxID=1855317 RepID=UPI0015A574B8|nr:DUF2934 domain-containing protein [Variovorax sp. OK605]